MEPNTTHNSSFGNHGPGSQSTNTGPGSQSVNIAGPQHFSVQKYFHISNPDLVSALDALKNADESTRQDHSKIAASDIIYWLHSLSKVNYTERQHLLRSQSTEGTGRWLLEAEEFRRWIQTLGGFLWMEGIIGAGKSTLASIIADHLNTPPAKEPTTCCIYIYLNDGDDSEGALELLYASLLTQLLHQHPTTHKISPQLAKRYQELKSQQGKPTSKVCLELLHEESKAFTRIFLVVDALDVLNPPTREGFLRDIRRFDTRWNILITTVSGASTESKTPEDLSMVVEARETDIKLYIKKRIENSGAKLIQQLAATEPAFDTTISEAIIPKASGMFLLVKLHMDLLEVEARHTPGHFRTMLNELPTDLTDTFDAAIQRIKRQDGFGRDVAGHVFSWLKFAMRPVTVDEVKYAFALDSHSNAFNEDYAPTNSQVISFCAGIVVIDRASGVLRLVHESALKHIRDSGLLPSDPRHEIARQCLAYLTYVSDDGRASSRQYSFLNYAAKHWLDHAKQVKPESLIDGRVLDFLRNEEAVSYSFVSQDWKFPGNISGLHACAYFGLERWARQLIMEGYRPNAVAADGSTPLHWAACNGRDSMVELLIQQKADVNAKDRAGDTPLYLAVNGMYEGIVKRLLVAKAKTDVRNRRNWTPLRWAIKLGAKQITRLLVESKAEIDVEDRDGWTPLRWAVIHQRLDLVQLMLKTGCDVNQRSSKDGWTALQHAAQYGYEGLALLLLKHPDLDVNRQDQGGLTPLRWAILHGKNPIVELLLQNGADANAKCKESLVPILQAARSSNELATWLLLSHGAQLNNQDNDGMSALHYAVKQGCTSILWLLVNKGADPNLKDNQGWTPLYWAVQEGNTSMAWFLVEKGAKSDSVDINGLGALHLAARLGHEKILHLLAKPGCIDQQDKNGMTALNHASTNGHYDSVNFLVREGANLDIADNHGATALHHAASQGQKEVVQVLLQGKARLDPQDHMGLTALHHAVLGGCIDIIAWLSEEPSILDIRDASGRTALICAAQKGNELATLCLIRQGAELGIQDSNCWTARDHAANYSSEKHKFIIVLLENAMVQQPP